MSHFYGSIQGNRGEATRGGSKDSGYTAQAASWQGSVRVDLSHDDGTGLDMAHVSLERWHGAGTRRTLYVGPVGSYAPAFTPETGPALDKARAVLESAKNGEADALAVLDALRALVDAVGG